LFAPGLLTRRLWHIFSDKETTLAATSPSLPVGEKKNGDARVENVQKDDDAPRRKLQQQQQQQQRVVLNEAPAVTTYRSREAWDRAIGGVPPTYCVSFDSFAPGEEYPLTTSHVNVQSDITPEKGSSRFIFQCIANN
jgi:hypothetical protein